MPQAAKNLLIILFIPFLLGVGHDLYVNYISDSEKFAEIKRLQVNPDDFMMSDIGWIWQEYSPSTLETIKDMNSTETWENKINPVLKTPTIIVTAIPFICGVIALALAFIIGVWPFSRYGKQRKADQEGYGIYKKARGKKTDYSRK
jgi:hypothetical protein